MTTERTTPRYGEDDGDEFFRADAARLGYLDPKPELAPGEVQAADDNRGRGLRAYYRDWGIVQPEVLRKELPQRELPFENIDTDYGFRVRGVGVVGVDIDSRPWAQPGRTLRKVEDGDGGERPHKNRWTDGTE